MSLSQSEARSSVQWLADYALRQAPRVIEGDDDWGKRKRVWAGVSVRRDGWQLKTHRKFREVKHGRWIQYTMVLPEADLNDPMELQIHETRPEVDATSGARRWWIDSSVTVPMRVTARIQRWNLGVRIFSLTVEARVKLRVRSHLSVAFAADYSDIPPALVIDPQVEHAQIALEQFEVDRLSHVGGDVAEGWGEVVQEVIVKTYLRNLNRHLVGKLNRRIEKERDDLRVSFSEWLHDASRSTSIEPIDVR